MIATQFFYTLCFIASLLGFGLVMFFLLCAGPDQKFFVRLIKVGLLNKIFSYICYKSFRVFLRNATQGTGFLLLGGGICGGIGVIIFAIWGNKDKWLPEHSNNFFGKFIR